MQQELIIIERAVGNKKTFLSPKIKNGRFFYTEQVAGYS